MGTTYFLLTKLMNDILLIKQANDDRVGQAKLYDAMDKVLDALRNLKEHSYPFLAKVSRREAPDYYDGIL
jgi:transcriptional activator SPT7